MDKLDINNSLNRLQIADGIKAILNDFEVNKNNILFKKGIFFVKNQRNTY